MPQIVSGAAPVTQTAPVQDATNVDFSQASDPLDAADAALRGDTGMVDGMRDVRDNVQTQEEYESEQASAVPESHVSRQPEQAATPQQRQAVAAALQLGKHSLTPEQASRLEKMLDEAQQFDMLSSAWDVRNDMYNTVRSAYDKHYQQSTMMRKQAQGELQQAKALKQAAEQLVARLQGGGTPQGQAQQQVPQLDPNDPFTPVVAPLYQQIAELKTMLQTTANKPSPVLTHQANQGWMNLSKDLGEKELLRLVGKIGGEYGIKPNEYGEFDVSALHPEQALALQQRIVSHRESTRSNGDTMDKWFANATKDLKLFPQSDFYMKTFWSQIAEEIENDRPMSEARFRQLALGFENQLKAELHKLGATQAQVRSDAGTPIVPNAGAASPASVEGMEEIKIGFNEKTGDVDLDAINSQFKRRAALTRQRKG